MTHSLTSLLRFCSQQNIKIHHSLEIAYHKEEDGESSDSIGVFLRNDVELGIEGIPEGTPVAFIPKSAVLSVKSTQLLDHLRGLDGGYSLAPCGIGIQSQLELTLAMLLEEMKGPSSQWHLYLQSLPRNRVELPLFWSLSFALGEIEDGKDKQMALTWLRGTELERQLRSGSNVSLDDLNTFFSTVVLPITQDAKIEAFYRAYSLVSSRAFVVDAYHGLAMVPVADAFNHATYNDVQLESEFDVCPECGSVQECVHDQDHEEDEKRVDFTRTAEVDPNEGDEMYYTMTTTSRILPGMKEIFNTYGSQLTNAELMVRYGFILDENDRDYVEFNVRDVLGETEEKRGTVGEGSNGTVGPSEDLEDVLYSSDELRINSDGRMSSALFTLLDRDPEKAIQLCQARLYQLTQEDVGCVLDELPKPRWRTPMVGMEVLTEQGILRSCIAGWEEHLAL
ncbi:SET domain-containing protein [Marasmius fiardii PR-910]|nr:SET domain-containing protein [Marasmius fiardii PR-910]